MNQANTSSAKSVTFLLTLWLVGAIVVCASGLPARLHPPAPQVVIAILTLVSLAAARLVPSLREWVAQVDVRALVALHITRLIAGINFLALGARQDLPRSFALAAGYGDIAVGLTAIVLIASVRPDSTISPHWRRYYQAWNFFGFADILFVVGNAARSGLSDPPSMAPLLHLPLSLLPTFLVPLIITTHLLLFRRLSGIRG